MAKTPKLKKPSKSSSSLHSRAARRAPTDPALNVDKSLLTCLPSSPPPPPSNTILGTRPGSGVSKKNSKGGKALSRQQRLRREKGLEKAEVVLGKRERKVERNLGKEVGVRERGVPWEELNEKIASQLRRKRKRTTTMTTTTGQKGKKTRKGGVEDDKRDEEWMDEDQDEDIGGSGQHEDEDKVSANAEPNGVQVQAVADDAEGGTRSKVVEIATVGVGDGHGDQPGEGEEKGESEDEVL